MHGAAGSQGPELFIDPIFRDQFRVALISDKRYNSFLCEEVPDVFVGTQAMLLNTLEVVASELEGAAARAALELPVWRRHEYLMSKWLPVDYSDEHYPAGRRGSGSPHAWGRARSHAGSSVRVHISRQTPASDGAMCAAVAQVCVPQAVVQGFMVIGGGPSHPSGVVSVVRGSVSSPLCSSSAGGTGGRAVKERQAAGELSRLMLQVRPSSKISRMQRDAPGQAGKGSGGGGSHSNSNSKWPARSRSPQYKQSNSQVQHKYSTLDQLCPKIWKVRRGS